MTTVAEAFDRFKLVRGVGDLETNCACTISAINYALTGELTDRRNPEISDVIRSWTTTIQDKMPDAIRGSAEWKKAALGIVGTGGDGKDDRRLELLKEHTVEHSYATAYAAYAAYATAYSATAYSTTAYSAAAYTAAYAAGHAAYSATAYATDYATAYSAWKKLEIPALLTALCEAN